MSASLVAIAATIASVVLVATAQDRPTFREAVDLIEVDVRVVTGTGVPVPSLAPGAFRVTIGGKQRRVVSADFVRYDTAAETPVARPVDRSTNPSVWLPATTVSSKAATGRIYALYVDIDTFDVPNSRNILTTAASFVERLQPNDQIGLFVFPVGSQVDPTTDHKGVLAKLAALVGTVNAAAAHEFALRPSEVAVLSTGSGSPRPDPRAAALVQALCGTDGPCRMRLANEVQFMVQEYESQAQHQLYNIRALLKGMAAIPGHKTLVIMSGGIPSTSRPGARPDIANLDMIAGQEAQRSDTAIYALFVDWHRAQISSAEQRRAPRFFTSIEEDSTMFSRSLDVFVGSAGGTLLKVLSGRGEAAFDQILRETSAYYILGVEPAEADRDSKPKQLNVKVTQPGTTVHGSRWVTVPRRQ